jgi:WD40 repeat protein
MFDWKSQTVLNQFPGATANGWTMLRFLSDGRFVGQSATAQMNIWNAYNGPVNYQLNTDVYSLEMLRNGYLVSSGSDFAIKVWNANTGLLVQSISTSAAQYMLRQTSIDMYLASGDQYGNLNIFNLISNSLEKTLTGHSNSICGLELMGNGNLLSASYDTTLKIWDMLVAVCLGTFTGFNAVSNAIRMISGNTFAIGGQASYALLVQINATNSFNTIANISLSCTMVGDMKVARNNMLIIGMDSCKLGFYNLTSLQYIQTLTPCSNADINYMDITGSKIDLSKDLILNY